MKMLLRLSREALKYKALYVIAILSTLLLTFVNLAAPKVMSEMTGDLMSRIVNDTRDFELLYAHMNSIAEE